MAHATSRRQHPNAPLTVEGRAAWSVASLIGVGPSKRPLPGSRSMPRRYVSGGTGLLPNESRDSRIDRRGRGGLRTGHRSICELRCFACAVSAVGADHIAFEVGLAASTVQGILNAAGVGRLDRGDRATNTEPIRRYQRETPGELIHVDIKKLAGIPDGGGWRTRGRGYPSEKSTKRRRAGYRYIHSAIDDRTRIAYSEISTTNKQSPRPGFGGVPLPGT